MLTGLDSTCVISKPRYNRNAILVLHNDVTCLHVGSNKLHSLISQTIIVRATISVATSSQALPNYCIQGFSPAPFEHRLLTKNAVLDKLLAMQTMHPSSCMTMLSPYS